MYNNFGLKYYDIINLFSGVESDFATPNLNSGRENIEEEIELQMGMLLQQIPDYVLKLFDEIPYVKATDEVEYIDGVGVRFKLPIVPDTSERFHCYYVNTLEDPDDTTLIENDHLCPNMDVWDYGTKVSVAAVSGSNCDYYAITDNVSISDINSYDFYIKYKVDSDSTCFSIKELKRILRDKVACVLGSRLMMENENALRLLDIVCSTKFSPDPRWVPAEYRKLKWWRPPWPTTLMSGNYYRDS